MSRACPDDKDEVGHVLREVPGITVTFSPDRIRMLGADIRRDSGFTTKQAEAFLTLYGNEFQAALEEAAKNFITKKVGK